MATERFARVAVPVPLGQAFTYAVPEALYERVVRGSRVLCPFGRRQVMGVVLSVAEDPGDVPREKLKPLRAVVDDQPVLPDELLSFLVELARYYLAPIGEVMRLALPSIERQARARLDQDGALDGMKVQSVGRLVQVAKFVEGAAEPEKLRGAALELFEHLRDAKQAPVSELTQRWGNARAAVKKLVGLGVVEIVKEPKTRDPFLGDEVERVPAPTPTPPQVEAVDAVCGALAAAVAAGQSSAFLLHGVTGSGKTEVYLRAAERCLELGGGVIVLVPEIALTPQLVTRFRQRLGDGIAVLHSGLSEVDRHVMWKRLRSGELKLAVGARSAVFAPVANLKLIVVDEEHDGSFKQEEGVRYHARDMARLRAHRSRAVCVLGSATPSLGSVAAVREKRMQRLTLPDRAHATATLPKVELVDLRRVGPGPSGHRLLSLPMHRALERVVEAGEQAILFLNRRGFAPSLLCESCGKVTECPNCSVSLTVHRSRGQRLHCHYCDFSMLPPSKCQHCGATKLSEEGAGTERIETSLSETFPTARVARLDRDVAAGLKSEKVLARMRAREIDILVGTQMVTKGHDLPEVTFVGVLNADAALSMPDFRAAERTFHLLVQVAGRAGRGDTPGTVMIQTRQPEHPAVALAAQHDVSAFIDYELEARNELRYPPFSRLVMVRIDSMDENRAVSHADRLADVAGKAAPAGVEILGPAPAPLSRLRNRFRFRFVMRAADRNALRRPLLAVARAPVPAQVRVSWDVDPESML